MAKLGRRRISKFSLAVAAVVAIAFGILLWGYTRPLPEYLIAKTSMGYGAQLSATALEVVRLDLGEISDNYLQPQDLTGDMALGRAIGPGELIPRGAIRRAFAGQGSIVTLAPTGQPSAEIAAGAEVEVWIVPEIQNSVWEPAQLLSKAEVISKIEPEGVFAADTGIYELLVPTSSLNSILEAIAKEHPIFLILSGS